MTLYDQVAYPSSPFRQTHPNRLAAPAVLLGLDPAPVGACRVLEIGCGDGGNLIPMALCYPGSEFIGFDIAAAPIARGIDLVGKLGLANIRLEVLDITAAAPADLGLFDYVIVHGVYSWVPEPVSEAMMALIAGCLSSRGLAMISYNALPGCRMRQALRDMLLYHLRGVTEPDARIAGARDLLSVLIQTYRSDDPIEAAFKTVAQQALARPPNVLFHDELADVFRPVYLHEFTAHASRHGLSVVAEAEPMWLDDQLAPSRYGPAIAALEVSDRLDVQQYRDFLTARQFRQTVVRRGPAPAAGLDVSRVGRLYAALLGNPGQIDASRKDQPILFTTPQGVSLEIPDPAIQDVIRQLALAWPQALPVASFGPDVAEAFIQLWVSGVVELLAAPDPFVLEVGERPTASPLARLQAAGDQSITTMRHGEVVVEDPASRHFITLLDGSRTQADLAAEMAGFFNAPVEDVAPKLAASLQGMARLPLLIA